MTFDFSMTTQQDLTSLNMDALINLMGDLMAIESDPSHAKNLVDTITAEISQRLIDTWPSSTQAPIEENTGENSETGYRSIILETLSENVSILDYYSLIDYISDQGRDKISSEIQAMLTEGILYLDADEIVQIADTPLVEETL